MLWVSCLEKMLPGRSLTTCSCSFGAVLEDFEVRDALNKIIANKGDYGHDMMQMSPDWHSPPGPDAFNG